MSKKDVMAWSMVLGLLIGLIGCQLFSSDALPAVEYTQADRTFYSLLVSSKVDFEGMINAREDLNTTQKEAIVLSLQAWEFMIQKAEMAQAEVGE